MAHRIFLVLTLMLMTIFPFATSAQNGNSVVRLTVQQALKNDFNRQRTIMISFEVQRRLLVFEGTKHKLARLARDRYRIRNITKKIIGWALLERLTNQEIARIIVYMYKADQAGANFDDSEDLIPLVAQQDIPIKKFVAMVQYNKETKMAGIPESIRQLLLTEALKRNYDSISILALSRGMILAKRQRLNLNKAATSLLRHIPPNGSQISSARMAALIKKAIGYKYNYGSQVLLANLAKVSGKIQHANDNNVASLVSIIQTTNKINGQLWHSGKIPENNKVNSSIYKQQNLIPDYDPKKQNQTHLPVGKKDWRDVSQSMLVQVSRPWIGTRYRWGGKTGPPHGPGVDCSGIVRLILMDKRIGVPRMPHGAAIGRLGRRVSYNNLQPGDLMFFTASPGGRKLTHMALVVSNKNLVHAVNRGVIFQPTRNRHWRVRFLFAKRMFRRVLR